MLRFFADCSCEKKRPLRGSLKSRPTVSTVPFMGDGLSTLYQDLVSGRLSAYGAAPPDRAPHRGETLERVAVPDKVIDHVPRVRGPRFGDDAEMTVARSPTYAHCQSPHLRGGRCGRKLVPLHPVSRVESNNNFRYSASTVEGSRNEEHSQYISRKTTMGTSTLVDLYGRTSAAYPVDSGRSVWLARPGCRPALLRGFSRFSQYGALAIGPGNRANPNAQHTTCRSTSSHSSRATTPLHIHEA
jgi:hypothetical protein